MLISRSLFFMGILEQLYQGILVTFLNPHGFFRQIFNHWESLSWGRPHDLPGTLTGPETVLWSHPHVLLCNPQESCHGLVSHHLTDLDALWDFLSCFPCNLLCTLEFDLQKQVISQLVLLLCSSHSCFHFTAFVCLGKGVSLPSFWDSSLLLVVHVSHKLSEPRRLALFCQWSLLARIWLGLP